MEKSLNILEWNINQRASHKDTYEFIFDEIIKTNPDLIFLVEYKKDIDFEEKLKENNYFVYSSCENLKKNEVLIAILNKENDFINIQKNTKETPKSLDFLSISAEIYNKKICLIGARIRVGKGDKNDYINRGKEISDLVNYTKEIKNNFDYIIISGDFNHAQIRQENNDDFEYKGYLQETCNYQKIKKMFKELKCEVLTPQGDNKEIYSFTGKSFGNNYYIKEDHIVVSTHIKCENIKYEWDFKHNPKYKEKGVLYPDHAKLISKIKLK